MSSVAESKEEVSSSQIGSQEDFKPGQTKPTPSPGSGDRVFYDTLLVQKPDSIMAQEWCVTYGTQDIIKHLELYKLVCKRKGRECDLSEYNKTTKQTNSARTIKSESSRKYKFEENDSGETGHEDSSVWEGKGTIGY